MKLLRAAVVVSAAVFAFAPAAPALAQDHDDHGVGGMTTAPNGWMQMPAEHLQTMIDAAPAGSVVSVPQAVYVGGVVLDKSLTLEGVGRPILDGAGDGSVLTITAPDVVVSNLDIRGSGVGPVGSPSGVMIEEADRARVQDVWISGSYIGITVRSSAGVVIDGVRIEGPEEGAIEGETHAISTGEAAESTHEQGSAAPPGTDVQLRGDGIWLWNAVDAVVRDSAIRDVRDGIYLSYGEGALLEGNLIERSRYAVHDMFATDLTIVGSTLRGNLSGCVLMYGGPVELRGNMILESGSASTGFGVLVKDAGSVTLEGNVVADNRIGVHVDDAGRTGGDPTRIEANTIAMNQIGVMVYPSTDATFVANAFVENSMQVTLGGEGVTQAVWTVDGVGNYWSDYGGLDAAGDGTGDLAYTQSGRMSRLLAQEPLLLALASGPAFRLLSAVDDRWSPAEPVVVDEAPLIESRAPALRGVRKGSSLRLWIPGLALTVSCAWLLVRARSGRRRPREVAAHG